MAKRESGNPKDKITAKIFHSRWMKAVSVMAGIVVFCTTYALILPAITMSAQDAKCGYEEHTHVAECYDAEGNLICGIEEHAHSLECYSDLYADIENPDEWSAEIPALSGERNANVVDVAWSQIGYRESDSNYLVSDGDQTQGYTRYGHWYGDVIDGSGERLENGLSSFAYADWDAMFVSFVLDNAGVYDFGYDYDSGNWAGALAAAGRYTDAADYIPEAGDLIFFTPEAGVGIKVGIVTDVNKGFLGILGDEVKSISVIVGNSNNSVEEIKVAVADYNEGDVVFETIHGYGILTPKEEVMDESVSSDVLTSDQAEAEIGAQEEVLVEELTEQTGEGVSEEQTVTEESGATDTSESEYVTDITEDNNHIIGADAEDLETVEITENEGVRVTVGEAVVSDNSENIVMNWQVDAQLNGGLSEGSIIRVDTASGKEHVLTVAEVKAWAGHVKINDEVVELINNDNYECTFIGSNGHLYTWDDVNAMEDDAVTTFTGIHVKVLADIAAVNSTFSSGFETTAKKSDANVGQNYYVMKASIDNLAGSATYTYKNGDPVHTDQNRVLQDSGLTETEEKCLIASGSDYTVTMTYGPDAEIPKSAKLKVDEIRQGTEEYFNYIAKAKATLGLNEEDICGRFFDIKIMTTEGEVVPKAAVKVDIKYDEAINTSTDNVNAVHFAKEGPEKVETESEEIDGRIESVGFTAESFSVYGIIYTVDFEFDGFEYSIEGGSSIRLSELAEILEIAGQDKWYKSGAEFIENVANVSFSDENLVSIERNGVLGTGLLADDWVLTSLGAFKTVETLTISMKDGSSYIINVTDDAAVDITKLLTDATVWINGEEVTDDNWSVVKGDTYTLTLKFQEQKRSGYQFPDDDTTMVYTLPAGVYLDEGDSGEFTMSFGRLGELTGNHYVISKNTEGRYVVNITWNTSDTVNFNYLTAAAEAKYSLNLHAYFDGESSEYKFSEDVEKHVDIHEPHDASVTKSGTYNPQDGKIHYRVTVVSNGTTDNVVVKDRISGSALNLNQNVTLKDANDNTLSYSGINYITSGSKTTGFDLNIGNLASGTYYVDYTAEVNINDLAKSGKTTYSETGNDVEVSADTDDNPDNDTDRHYEFEINYSSTDKKSTKVGDIQTDGDGKKYRLVDWRIEVNKEQLISIASSTIKDTITTPNNMEYYGQGINVSVYNGDQLVTSRSGDVNWSDLTAHSASSWMYTVDPSDGNYSYVITYQTKAYVDASNDINVTNNVETDKDSEQGTAFIPHDDTETLPTTKTHTAATNGYVDWQIIVNVPADGIDELVVEDFIPNHQSPHSMPGGGEYYFYDVLDKNSINVTGTENGETWEPIVYTYPTNAWMSDDEPANAWIAEGDPGPVETFKMTFKNNTGSGPDALTNTGENRTITITYRTYVNQEWLDMGEQSAWYNAHENKVKINNGRPKTHSVEILKKTVKKVYDHTADSTVTVTDDDGTTQVKLPVYRYYVDITNLQSDELIIEDKFDTSIFELYDGGLWQANCVTGGSYDNPSASAPVPTVTTEIKDESDKTTGTRFYLNPVPKTNGAYYAKYRLFYYLKVKSPAALRELQERAAKNGGKVTISNTATWDNASNKAEFDYNYKIVDKTVESDSNDSRKANYTIIINKDKLTLGNSDMTLTDTFTNQSVDYTSVKILINDQEVEGDGGIKYDFSGNTGTFLHIPDATKVTITYSALIIGAGTVSYSNTATLNEIYRDSTEEMKSLGSDMAGDAIFPYIYLFKYEKGNMAHGLEHARFRLLDSEKLPIKNKNNEEIIFDTDDDGKVMVYLHNMKDGMVLDYETVYYLEEIDAPTGFGKDYTMYSFIISDQAEYDTETGAYIYYNGDIMKVSDPPSEAQLVLMKQLAGNEELTEAERNAITFTITWTDPITSDTESKTFTYGQMYTYNEASAKNSAVMYLRKEGLCTKDDQGNYSVIDPNFKLKAGNYSIVESNQNQGGYMYTTTYRVDGDLNLQDGSGGKPANVMVTSEDISTNKEHDVVFTNTYYSYVYKFEKVDSSQTDTIAHLFGAVFTVYKWNGDAENGTWVEAGIEYTTPKNGTFTVQFDKSNSDNKYTYNTAYYVEEKTPPNGYEMPDEPAKYYFYFSNADSSTYPVTGPAGFNTSESEYVDLITQNPSTVMIGNAPKDDEHTKITAKKVWMSGETDVTSTKTGTIDFDLYQVATTTSGGASAASVSVGQYSWNDGVVFTEQKDSLPDGTVVTITIKSTGTPELRCWDAANSSCNYYNGYQEIELIVGDTEEVEGKTVNSYTGIYTVDGSIANIQFGGIFNSYDADVASVTTDWTYPSPQISDNIYDSYTISSQSGWKLEIPNLPKQKTNGDGSITTYKYYVVETSTGNFTGVVDFGDSQTAIGGGTVTITNTLTGVDFNIIKKGDQGEELSGAKFKLLKKNGSSEYVIFENEKLDSNGEVTVPGHITIPTLEEGEYKLTETSTPSDEYVLSNDMVVYFKIVDGAVMLTDAEGNVISAQTDVTFENATVTITNHKGHSLPHTGGIGTKPYRMAGIVIVITALLSVFIVNRRGRRLDGR